LILKFLGGASEVTGSAILIITENGRLLRDCGIFQGHREESHIRNLSLLERSGGIDAVVISHAHLDHCGNLPTIVKDGFRGNVFVTPATADLMPLMWEDAVHIQEHDLRFLSKRGVKVPPLLKPLYDLGNVMEAERLIVKCEYNKPVYPLRGTEVVFTEAGHILGSALNTVTVKEGKKKTVIGFAFDLGRKNMPVIKEPEFLHNLDILVIESTYGGREHEKIEEVENRLASIILKTLERKGKVIIPSFALGRTQEVLYSLKRLIEKNIIPKIPIFVDSPLAGRITEVFRKHIELFSKESLEEGLSFLEDKDFVKFTISKEESQEINEITSPCIIIAASGMCEGGRILHHLMRTIEDEKNTILFVGFQANNTLGRRILEKQERVKIFDGSYRVKAEVTKLNAYSAHAGKSDLLEFISKSGKVKDIILVHGENNQIKELANAIPAISDAKIHIPVYGEEIEF